MAPQPRTRTTPCDKCREKHLKCDGQTPCANCNKSSSGCVRATKKFRVKRLITTHSTFAFDPNQTWIQTASQKKRQTPLSIIDETNNAPNRSTRKSRPARDEPSDPSLNAAAEVLQSFSRSGQAGNDGAFVAPSSLDQEPSPPDNDGDDQSQNPDTNDDQTTTNDNLLTPSSSVYDKPLTFPFLEPEEIQPAWHHARLDEPSGEIGDSGESQAESPFNQHHASIRVPYTLNTNDNPGIFLSSALGMQEGCLVRCFIEKLAASFDTNDRDHHFVNVVPIRAMYSPLLLNAICAASSRYLTRVSAIRNPNGTVEYNGIFLPELNEASTIHYHNKCISYLMDVSRNPTEACSDDALTAISILRYDEQVDSMDNETFSIAIQTVFEAQQHTSFGLFQPPRDQDIFAPSMPSLRFSACWIAFRQEIWSVLMHRRPFRLPILAVKDYANFSAMEAADDHSWTNCIISWCAHVLKFCFSEEVDSSAENRKTRSEEWNSLKEFERFMDETPPPHFMPLYYKDRNPSEGQYFPTIWMANQCQVVALQHIEIARIVLAVHDPKPQRIGIGASAAHQALGELLRQSTRRICGLAMCDQKFQAAMVTAGVGISMCGEYFHDLGEQEAIIELMSTLEKEHAWPTSRVLDALKSSWKEHRAMYC